MKSPLLSLVAASTVLLLTYGCSGGDADRETRADTAGTQEVERGGTVVIAELHDMSTPLIALATTVLDGTLAADVMSMELLRGVWRDGEVHYATADESPVALARRFEHIGADSAGLRFHMRSDVSWSDGQPLTAHDVVFTYDLVREPALASPRQDFVARLDSVVAENDSTVVFHFQRRYPEMLSHSSLAVMPRHVFEGTAADQLRSHPAVLDPTDGKLPVSGPYMIGRWRKGQEIVLVPNPNFRPRPNLDQIIVRVIPDVTTRMVELRTGGVDFVQNVPSDQIPALRSEPHVRLEREEKRYYDFIAYNPGAMDAFADPEIRRALGLAIDSRALIAALRMEEFAIPAGGPLSPALSAAYDPALTPPLTFDPDGARRILERKGWRDADGDGILEKDGRPFRFTLATNSGNQRRADAAQIVQASWRRIGVDAQVRTLEFNTFMGGLFQKEYEAALSGWGVNLSPDLTALWGEDAPPNITGYRNPEVSAAFQRALSEPTPEAALPHWRRAASLIAQDQPYTWLYYFDAVDARNERLRGMRVDTYSAYNNVWEWWVPADSRPGRRPAAPAESAGVADSARAP